MSQLARPSPQGIGDLLRLAKYNVWRSALLRHEDSYGRQVVDTFFSPDEFPDLDFSTRAGKTVKFFTAAIATFGPPWGGFYTDVLPLDVNDGEEPASATVRFIDAGHEYFGVGDRRARDQDWKNKKLFPLLLKLHDELRRRDEQ